MLLEGCLEQFGNVFARDGARARKTPVSRDELENCIWCVLEDGVDRLPSGNLVAFPVHLDIVCLWIEVADCLDFKLGNGGFLLGPRQRLGDFCFDGSDGRASGARLQTRMG